MTEILAYAKESHNNHTHYPNVKGRVVVQNGNIKFTIKYGEKNMHEVADIMSISHFAQPNIYTTCSKSCLFYNHSFIYP
jgi:hypothetical protein